MRGSDLLRRRGLAAAFVCLCGAVLATCLGGQSERVAVREPLVPHSARGPLVRVPLEASASSGRPLSTIRIAASGAAGLLAHDEVRLFVSAEGPGERRVVRAELRAPGGACRFEAVDVRLVEGEPLSLRRAAGCWMPERPTTLELAVEAPEGVGLWAHRSRPGSSDRGPLLVDAPGGAGPLSVRGFVVDWPATAPRVALLSAMWRRAGSSGWLWWLLLLGLTLVMAGCLVVPTEPRPGRSRPGGRRFVLASAAGAGLLAGGLAVLYVVATPPLSGPDEPYHLMGLSELVGETARVDDTLAWMAETHQMRIRHHPQERFRTIDVGRPEEARDPEARSTETAQRSAMVAAAWRGIAPAIAGASAPRTLLAIRLLHALVFALAMGASTALAASCAEAVSPQWIPVALLMVPTLPFFAMHVSETALLCGAYVLLGTTIAVMFLDGPRAYAAGLALGLATSLLLAGGRSPWPLGGLVGAAVAGRVLLGPAPGAPRRGALVFWLGFGLGGLVFYALLTPDYVASLTFLSRRSLVTLQPAVERTLSSPWLLVAVVATGLALETVLAALRPHFSAAVSDPAGRAARWAALSLGALVVTSLMASLVLPLPDFPLEPSHPLTLGERLVGVLATSATLFRLREPNFLLATSFWVGFGWLDAIPGPVLQAALVVLVAAATLALLWSLARPPQARRVAFLLLLVAGGAITLALYTVITQGQPLALHGRYLIGWYLVFLSIAACGVAGVSRGDGARTPVARRLPGILLVALGAIHTYCLCFILRRYF